MVAVEFIHQYAHTHHGLRGERRWQAERKALAPVVLALEPDILVSERGFRTAGA
jgi:hypothetical protein